MRFGARDRRRRKKRKTSSFSLSFSSSLAPSFSPPSLSFSRCPTHLALTSLSPPPSSRKQKQKKTKNQKNQKNQNQVPWPEAENSEKNHARTGSARSASSALRPLVASQGQDLSPQRDGPAERSKAHAVRPLSSNLSVFAVFDGHNGPLAAEHLAETLIETLHARLPKGRPPRRQGCCLSDSGKSFF